MNVYLHIELAALTQEAYQLTQVPRAVTSAFPVHARDAGNESLSMNRETALSIISTFCMLLG